MEYKSSDIIINLNCNSPNSAEWLNGYGSRLKMKDHIIIKADKKIIQLNFSHDKLFKIT